MNVISTTNIKGGVGKSTTAAILGAGLASRGFRTLLIDDDPQSNLTMCYMPEPEDGTPTLYHVYSKSNTIKDIRQSVKLNLDLVPGDFELCAADMEFTDVGRLNRLNKALKEVSSDYDYVIIDTPPNLGVLTLNALMASDFVIVPLSVDSFSLKGIRLLNETLNDVREEMSKQLTVIGLLLTRYSTRTNLSKMLEQSVNSAADLLQTSLFTSRIRQSVTVQESQIAQVDLLEYAPRATVTADYQAFIDELLTRIKEKEA